MSDSQRISLDELISPAAARVVVAPDGRARFDLESFPRVDGLLRGKQVENVPKLVEHLCGICPVAHHLAGIEALENLMGVRSVSDSAAAVRALLHYASVIDTHAVRLARHDPKTAVALRRFAKLGLTAAGAPSHFPDVAIPGGVRVLAEAAKVAEVVEQLEQALELAETLAEAQFTVGGVRAEFDGADLALVNRAGEPDMLGEFLRVARDGKALMQDSPRHKWPELIREANVGANAPKPYLAALGESGGKFRVGPVSQLRVGALTTPRAAAWQERWDANDGSAPSARAVVLVHAVEMIARLVKRPELVEGTAFREPTPPFGEIGIGWVDGPRGLLVHTYRADENMLVTDANILTPTAQNEVWLSDMLSSVAASDDPDAVARMERSIREADPCLPCVEVPEGMMDLEVVEGEG